MTVPLRFKLFSKDTCFVILVSLIASISKKIFSATQEMLKVIKISIMRHVFIRNRVSNLLL